MALGTASTGTGTSPTVQMPVPVLIEHQVPVVLSGAHKNSIDSTDMLHVPFLFNWMICHGRKSHGAPPKLP